MFNLSIALNRFSKILFQHTARKEPMTIDELLAAAESLQQVLMFADASPAGDSGGVQDMA